MGALTQNEQTRTVALYARVSTKDRQDTENQLRELRDYCKKHGWTIAGEYVEQESGQIADRPAFKELFQHAHQLRFDTVLFWALDRFSREGVHETLNHLKCLEESGVAFKSYTEPYLDTLGPFRDAVIGILASLANQEIIRRSERARAGMERAKLQGKRIVSLRSRNVTKQQRYAVSLRSHRLCWRMQSGPY